MIGSHSTFSTSVNHKASYSYKTMWLHQLVCHWPQIAAKKTRTGYHWLMTMKSWSRKSMVEISKADRLVKLFCSWQSSLLLHIGCIVTRKAVGLWWMHMFAYQPMVKQDGRWIISLAVFTYKLLEYFISHKSSIGLLLSSPSFDYGLPLNNMQPIETYLISLHCRCLRGCWL